MMPVVRGKNIEVLFSASAIARRNLELAKEIAGRDYHDLLVISILKGSFVFAADLIRATRFELKPQGVCQAKLCFPIPKARKQEFLRKNSGQDWFNLTAFAQLVQQPVAHDAALSTWYFGLRADQRQTLSSLQAPDFTLPDVNGKMHSLSDFKGRKVFLITWASW